MRNTFGERWRVDSPATLLCLFSLTALGFVVRHHRIRVFGQQGFEFSFAALLLFSVDQSGAKDLRLSLIDCLLGA